MNETYRYQMRRRPFDIGAQPHGHVDYIHADKRTDDRELSADEVARFELRPEPPEPRPEMTEAAARIHRRRATRAAIITALERAQIERAVGVTTPTDIAIMILAEFERAGLDIRWKPRQGPKQTTR